MPSAPRKPSPAPARLRCSPTGWCCERASHRRFALRRSKRLAERWAASALPAEPGLRDVSALATSCSRWRHAHAPRIYRFRWRDASGNRVSPSKRPDPSGGPASSPTLVSAFTLPPASRCPSPPRSRRPGVARRSSCSTYIGPPPGVHIPHSPPNASPPNELPLCCGRVATPPRAARGRGGAARQQQRLVRRRSVTWGRARRQDDGRVRRLLPARWKQHTCARPTGPPSTGRAHP